MQKRWLLLTAGLGVFAAIAHLSYQQYHRQQLFANCYSDKLHPIAGRLEQFSRDHKRFPGRTAFFSSLSEESSDWLGTCSGSNQPFVWNPGISEIPVGSTRKELLLWCPPGSHGRHVGVVVLSGGAIKPEIMTRTGLNELLAAPTKNS